MRCARGNIEAGLIPTLLPRPVRVLDLYERVWEDTPLGADDFVISADEKTSVQARRRKQPTLPPASTRPIRVEHEYFREGAWTYLAAWDVHRAKVFGRCEVKNGIAPVDRLVGEVMSQAPYKTAHPTTSVLWPNSNSVSLLSRRITNAARRPSGGLLHAKISRLFWLKSTANLLHLQLNHALHNTSP
jgi:hypothetical protein